MKKRGRPCLTEPVSSKRCCVCKQTLPASQFGTLYHNVHGVPVLRGYCKRCDTYRKHVYRPVINIPPWLTLSHIVEIRAIYDRASCLSLRGEPHEVDHIYPSQGVTCSGLHVPWNLRVVTRAVNRRKSNIMPEPVGTRPVH